jgi:hypothetical protein
VPRAGQRHCLCGGVALAAAQHLNKKTKDDLAAAMARVSALEHYRSSARPGPTQASARSLTGGSGPLSSVRPKAETGGLVHLVLLDWWEEVEASPIAAPKGQPRTPNSQPPDLGSDDAPQ